MTTDLVHLPDVTAPPSPLEWTALKEQADVVHRSGLAPATVDTPEKVLVIALKGRELRIPPMQALSHINVIDGKPTLSAELMTALVRRAGHKLRIIETTGTRCVIEAVRADDPDYPTKVEFTLEEAERAGLLSIVDGKPRARSRSGKTLPWEAHTSTMLRWRAISACCRAVFPDVLMGASYTPEELGAQVDPETGEILTVEVEHAYRDPAWTAALDELEQLLADAEAAGVDGDPQKARAYASLSLEHTRKAIGAVREKLSRDEPEDTPEPPAVDDPPDATGDIVDAEVVDDPDDTWDGDPPTPDPDPFDWRAHATANHVNVVPLLNALRSVWPTNSEWNKPNRSKDIDDLCRDDVMADIVRATIDDLAAGR